MAKDKPPREKAFYSVQELCERWQMGRATLYREIERGKLKRRHFAGLVRFAAADVAEYELRASDP